MSAGAAAEEKDDAPAFELLDEILTTKGRFSEDASRRIRAAIQAYANGMGSRGLDECLGWKPLPGERSIARRLAEARYLAAFADAWRALNNAEHLSNWARCEVLVSELAEFERTNLPVWREKGTPEGASILHYAIFRIFSTVGRAPPKTANGIFELLKRARVLNRDRHLA